MARVLHLDARTLAAAHASPASLLAALNGRGGDDGALIVANRLWGQRGLAFRPEFLSLLADRYHAPLEQVDFLRDGETARRAINDWASPIPASRHDANVTFEHPKAT